MKTLKFVSIMLIAFVSIIGCSGNYGKLKTQNGSESKITQQELIDNWSEYNVYFTRYYHEASSSPFRATIIVFDPKNSDRKILVGSNWRVVKDQETWTEIVKANTTSDGDFAVGRKDLPNYPKSFVVELWGPDNQLYGIIIRPKDYNWVIAKRVDENTMRLSWQITGGGSPAK